MPSEVLVTRLTGIQKGLIAAYTGGGGLSSASKGREREAFVQQFLGKVFPQQFRFGSGDILDSDGNKSGQLDLVIEYPFGPSLPLVGSDSSRLYLAENVAATIEVKSDIESQWSEALNAAQKVFRVRRRMDAGTIRASTQYSWKIPEDLIPFFVVGFTGWRTLEPIRKHLAEASDSIHGVLVIDPCIFVPAAGINARPTEGPLALWTFIACVHTAIGGVAAAMHDLYCYGE